ncbi:hypothetical protein [Azotosporobacter soli]|uniref:hypothetical protein n=1 Tax=Azotosporobacter soli TaxID=3055040 RepID=UPI0031FF3860
MLRILMLCLFVLQVLGGSVEAAEWQWLGSTEKAAYYVDASSLKAEKVGDARYITAWFKCEYVSETENIKESLKKLRFEVSADREVKCTQAQEVYYNAQQKVWPHTDDSFAPHSMNELFFAALTDYLLGTEANWLNKLDGDDRWVWVGATVDDEDLIWFDQYRSRLLSAGNYQMYIYKSNKEGQYRVYSRRFELEKRQIDHRAVVPDSIGVLMLEKAEQMMKTPSVGMIQWRAAMTNLRRVIAERAAKMNVTPKAG